MTKKRKNYDDLGQGEFIDMGSELPMPQNIESLLPGPKDFYVDLGVDKIKEEIRSQSKVIVEKIIEIYFRIGEEVDPEYIESLKRIEELSLENLLLQVKYSEHLVTSLMRRLDGVGFVDPNVFKTIVELQNNTLSITMSVSNYIRNMPSYFKNLKYEMTTDIAAPLNVNNALVSAGDASSQQIDDEDMYINKPHCSTRELLKHIKEQKEKLAKETFEQVDKMVQADKELSAENDKGLVSARDNIDETDYTRESSNDRIDDELSRQKTDNHW